MADNMKVQLHQISISATEAEFRKHRIKIDRPVSKGGSDTGPMGGELFLAAVGTEVTATIEGTPPRFVSMELLVTAEGEDLAQLEKLVQIAERGCIMVN